MPDTPEVPHPPEVPDKPHAPAPPVVVDPPDEVEEYLERLLDLEDGDEPPTPVRLAERLSHPAPMVAERTARLAREGLVEVDSRGALRLTGAGRTIAVSVVRRHRLAERLLVDVVGIAWEQVHREASRWQSVISAEVEERLVELLGDPATCPHGNPIPGSRRPADQDGAVLLVGASGPVTVARIEEELEEDDEALRLLAGARLMPGCAASVLGNGAEGVVLRTPTGDHLVPARVARLTWVTPRPAP